MLFQLKEKDYRLFKQSKNSFNIEIREEDGFPISLLLYNVSGYIYEPYNNIQPIINIPFIINYPNVTVDTTSLNQLSIDKRYRYKINATNKNTNDSYIVQFGNIDIMEENR